MQDAESNGYSQLKQGDLLDLVKMRCAMSEDTS